MMAGIRAKNTKPEMIIRSALHKRGFRYRLHYKGIPGTPDLFFPAKKAAIFVNGCFWHAHGCHLFKMPKTRTDFWSAKLHGNAERDDRNRKLLEEMGIRHLTIWECELKSKSPEEIEAVIEKCNLWLGSSAE